MTEKIAVKAIYATIKDIEPDQFQSEAIWKLWRTDPVEAADIYRTFKGLRVQVLPHADPKFRIITYSTKRGFSQISVPLHWLEIDDAEES